MAKARWQLTARHGGGYQYRRAATASQHIALRTPLIAPPTPLIAPPTRTRTASAAGHSAPRRPPPALQALPCWLGSDRGVLPEVASRVREPEDAPRTLQRLDARGVPATPTLTLPYPYP